MGEERINGGDEGKGKLHTRSFQKSAPMNASCLTQKVLEETISLSLALTSGKNTLLALIMKAKSWALALDSETCPC